MRALDLREEMSARLLFIVVLAVVSIAGLAAAGPTDDLPVPVGASPASEQPCGWDVTSPPGPRTPHPAIRIDGDDLNEPATLATVPAAEQPVYRPGSGIVAGNGTPQNPYLIAGWHLPRLKIQNNDAHFVIADNTFDARMAVLPGLDPDADPLPSVIPKFVDRATWIVDAPNVSVIENTGSPILQIGQSRGTCIAANQFTPQKVPGLEGEARPWMEVCGSPATQVLDNDGLLHLTVGSRHLRIAGNAFTEGILLEGHPCHVRPHQGAPPDPQPAFFDHTIPPTNTANGQPLLYINGATNTTVNPPAGQVLLHNTTNFTVQDVSIPNEPEHRVDDLVTAFSRNVTFRNVTTEDVDRIRVTASPNTTIRGSSFEDNRLWVKRSPNMTLEENDLDTVRRIRVIRSPDTRIADNHMEDFGQLTLREGSARTAVVGNHFEGSGAPPGHLVLLDESRQVRVQENTVHLAPRVLRVSSGSTGLVVSDNRFTITFRGVVLEGGTGTLNISHNLIKGPGGDQFPEGIYTSDQPAEVIIEANEFRKLNDDAIRVLREASIASIEGNNFREGVEAGVRADEPVDATHNWWGCPEGPLAPDCADAKGPVTVDPWLTSPNPDAGPRE